MHGMSARQVNPLSCSPLIKGFIYQVDLHACFVPALEWLLLALCSDLEPGPQVLLAEPEPGLPPHPLQPPGPALNQNHLATLAHLERGVGWGGGRSPYWPLCDTGSGSSCILSVQPWCQPAQVSAWGQPHAVHSRARLCFCVFKEDISSSVLLRTSYSSSYF